MSAETSGDVCHIKDEDVLRKMWQDTEDFGRKKEIRSHMYKLREERLRNFYSDSTENTSTHHNTSIKDGNRPNHAQSLLDHSFLSMKSKEIRDSESPTKDMHQFRLSSDKNANRGWEVVSKNEVSDDGKTHTLSKVATTSGSEKIDKGVANYSAKCEQKASVYEDGDANNFTKSSTAASKSFLQQDAKGGDDNSSYQTHSTSSSLSSKTVTQHRSGSDIKPVPNKDDSSVIVRKTYTTDVPADLKRNPNYIDGNTTVTTETRTLPDGSKVTTTRYETKGISSKIDQHKFHTEQKSKTTYDERQHYQTVKESDNTKNIITQNSKNIPKTDNAISSTVHLQKDYVTRDTNNKNETIRIQKQDERSTRQENRDDFYVTQTIRENEYMPRDHKPTAAKTTSKKDDDQVVSTVRTTKIVREGGYTPYEPEPESTPTTRRTTVKDTDDGSTINTIRTTKIVRENEYIPHEQQPMPNTDNTTRTTTVKKNDDGSTVTTVRTTKIVNVDGYTPQEQQPEFVPNTDNATKTTTVKKNDDGSIITTVRTTKIVREDGYTPLERQPEPTVTKTTSKNVDDSVTTVKTTKIVREDGYSPYEKQPEPRNEKPDCVTSNRRPGDYKPVQSTPGEFTPTLSTPGNQTPVNSKLHEPIRPQEIIITLSTKPVDQPTTNDNQIIRTTYTTEPKSPVKPTTEKITSVTTHTTYKTDYTTKRISVDISPTHDAFARSLRASPDRDQKRGSTRSLKSSTSSLRTSVSPDKKHPDHRDKTSPTKWPSTTKARPDSRESSPTKKSPNQEINTDTITRRRKTDHHTTERKTTHKPHSRSPSPTTSTSDIEYIRKSDIVTDLDDDKTTTTITRTKKPVGTTQRPDTLTFNNKQPSKQSPSPTSKKPTSPNKTPEKPFKRRDTYEERCRQILGISEQTTDVRKTTERTNSRKTLTEPTPRRSPDEKKENTSPKDRKLDTKSPERKSPEKRIPMTDDSKPKGRKPNQSPERPNKVPHDQYYVTKQVIDTKTTTTKTNKSFPNKPQEETFDKRQPVSPSKSRTPTEQEPDDLNVCNRPDGKNKPYSSRPTSKSPDRPYTVNKETDDYYVRRKITEHDVVTSKPDKPGTRRHPSPDSTTSKTPRPRHEPHPSNETPDFDRKFPRTVEDIPSDHENYRPGKRPVDDTTNGHTITTTEVTKRTDVYNVTDQLRPDRKSPDRKSPEKTDKQPKGQKPLDKSPQKTRPDSETTNKHFVTNETTIITTTDQLNRRSPVKEPVDKPSQKTQEIIPKEQKPTDKFLPKATDKYIEPKRQKPFDKVTDERYATTEDVYDETVSTKTTKSTKKIPERSPERKHPTTQDKSKPRNDRPGEEFPVSEYTDEYCERSPTPTSDRKQPRKEKPIDNTATDKYIEPKRQEPFDKRPKVTDKHYTTTEDVYDETVSTKTTKSTKKSPEKSPERKHPTTQDKSKPRNDRPGEEFPVSEYTDEYCEGSPTPTSDKKQPRKEKPIDSTATDKYIEPKRQKPFDKRPSKVTDKHYTTTEDVYDETVSTKTTKSTKKSPEKSPERKHPTTQDKSKPRNDRPGEEFPVSEYTDEYCEGSPTPSDKKHSKKEKPTDSTDDYYVKKKITEERFMVTQPPSKTPSKKEPKPVNDDKKPTKHPDVTDQTSKYYVTSTTTTDKKTVKKQLKDYRSSDDSPENTDDDETFDETKQPSHRTKPNDREPVDDTDDIYYTATSITDKKTTKVDTHVSKSPKTKEDIDRKKPKEPGFKNLKTPSNQHPDDVTEDSDEYYSTNEVTDRKTISSKTLLDKSEKTKPTSRKPHEESPDDTIDDTEEYYSRNKLVTHDTKTITSKTPKPVGKRPSDTSEPKGHKPSDDTDDADVCYVTLKETDQKTTTTRIDHDTSKPKGYKPTDNTDSKRRPVSENYKPTNRKPYEESPDDTIEGTEDFYTKNKIVIKDTKTTTTTKTPEPVGKRPSDISKPKGYKPTDDIDDTDVCYVTSKETDQKTTTTRTDYVPKDSKRRPVPDDYKPTNRKPHEESPDYTIEDTEDFYTKNKVVIKDTKITTSKTPEPVGKRPSDTPKPKGYKPTDDTDSKRRPVSEDHKPTNRKPYEDSPDDTIEDTEDFYSKNKVVIKDTKITTSKTLEPVGKRPSDTSKPKGYKPSDDTDSKRRPVSEDYKPTNRKPYEESPDDTIEDTEDFYSKNTVVIKDIKITTSKTPEPVGKRPSDNPKPKGYKPTDDTDSKRRPISEEYKPTNRKPYEDSPDDTIEDTEDYYTKNKLVIKDTKITTSKTPEPVGKRPSDTSKPKGYQPTDDTDLKRRPVSKDHKPTNRKSYEDSPDDTIEDTEDFYSKNKLVIKDTKITTSKTPEPVGKRPSDTPKPKGYKPTDDTDLKRRPVSEDNKPKNRKPYEESPDDIIEDTEDFYTKNKLVIKDIKITTSKTPEPVGKRPLETSKPKGHKPIYDTDDTNICYVTSKETDQKTTTTRTDYVSKDSKRRPVPEDHKPMNRKPYEESPDDTIEGTEDFYTKNKVVIKDTKTTTSKTPEPVGKRPSDTPKPKGYKPTDDTDSKRRPVLDDHKPTNRIPYEESPDDTIEDTEDFYTKNKLDTTSKTPEPVGKRPSDTSKPKGYQPTDDTDDSDVCYVTSQEIDQKTITTRTDKNYTNSKPQRPTPEDYKDTESPYDTIEDTDDYYTTKKTSTTKSPDRASKRPIGRKPDYDDEETYDVTDQRKTTTKTIQQTSPKHPHYKANNDMLDDSVEDYYTTNRTTTQKTTMKKTERTPVAKGPKSTQKYPSDETKPKGQRPTDVTEKRYITNKTTDIKIENAQKRPADTKPRTSRPIHETPGRYDVTENTQEHYTTTAVKTITAKTGRIPTTYDTKPKGGHKPQEPEERYVTRKTIDHRPKTNIPDTVTKRPKSYDDKPKHRRPENESPDRLYEITVDECYEIDDTRRRPIKKSPEKSPKRKDSSKSPDRSYRVNKETNESHITKTTKKVETHSKPLRQKSPDKAGDSYKPVRKIPDQTKPKTDRQYGAVEEVHVHRYSETRFGKTPKDKTKPTEKPMTTEYVNEYCSPKDKPNRVMPAVISRKPNVPDTTSRKPVQETFTATKTYLTTDKETVHRLDRTNRDSPKKPTHKIPSTETPRRKIKPEDDEDISDDDTLVRQSSREPSLSPDRSCRVPEGEDFYTLNIKVYKTDSNITQRHPKPINDTEDIDSDVDRRTKTSKSLKPKSVEPGKTKPGKPGSTIYRTEEKHYINKLTKPTNKTRTPKRDDSPERRSPVKQVQKITNTRRITNTTDSKYSTRTKPKLEETRHVVTTTIQVVPKSKPQDKKKPTTKTSPKTSKPISQPINKNKPRIPSECERATTEEESDIDEYTVDGEQIDENRPYNRQITHTISDNQVQPESPLRRPDKVITTKSIIINNDFENDQEVIVKLQRSKSSRETTPDRTYVYPASDNEDKGIPRYPDEISEPDDVYKRRKPTKLSDIPIIETEDIDTHKVEETDECLLSVNEKVNKFVNEAVKLSKTQKPDRVSSRPDTKLNVTQDVPKRPKSPKCENYPEDDDETYTSVSKKVSHFIETAEKIKSQQKPSYPAPKVKRPEFTDLDETIKTDDCLLSVSDKVNKFTVTSKTQPDYKKPVSLSKMDEPVSQPRSPIDTTECVQIDSEEDTYSRTPKHRETSPRLYSKTPTETDSTPKSNRKVEPRTILSTTSRLRSTESIRKAKEIFETIAKDQIYKPEQKPQRERTPTNEDFVPSHGVHDKITATKKTDALKSTRLVMEKVHQRHSPSKDDDIPGYMRPLNRSTRPHSPYVERTHSSTDRSRSPSVEPYRRPHDESLENIPHYMWPLDRAPHEHDHHHHDSREHSPVHREPSPHLKHPERQKTPSRKTEPDVTDKPTKFGTVLHKTDSEKVFSQRRKLTTIELENILTTHEIEEIYDIEILEILLERAVNYEQRRKIRAQIRIVKQLIIDNKLPNVLIKKLPKTDRVKEPSVEKCKPSKKIQEQTYTYSERRRSSEVKEVSEINVSRKSPDRKPESKKPETKNVFKTELKRVEPVSKKVVEEKPSWVTQRPLKKPSGDVPKSKPLSTTTKKQDSRVSPPKERKSIDAITSSYGVGPTDENGSPLFGLKALRAQTKTGTTKVQGTVIKSHYYSENGHEPVGEVSVTKYSTDPSDFEGDIVDETGGLVSVTTTKKFGAKGTPTYRAIEDKEDSGEDSHERTTQSTTITRRGSVKQMSKKFIENAVETSKNERQSSYPKAGLILRTSSFKKSTTQDSSREASPEPEVTTTTVRRTVTSSTSGERTDTFLNNQKRVSNVQDVITRMRNADDDVEEGDTVEDAEARKLLNKFIGSQVILSGMESHSSSSPVTTTVKRTTTTTSTSSKGGGKPTVITRTFTHPITQEDLDTIWDEQTLKLLLERSTDYEERRIIRGRLRDVMAEKEVCVDVTKTSEESSGRVEETIEKSKSEGPVTTTQVTRITSQQVSKKPISPFAKFRQLDKQNSRNTPPGTPRTPTGSAPLFKFTDPELSRQASTVKERLLQWCQMKTKEYENVQLDNFSSSWADGLGFCALIHHFLPDAFDYHALTPQDRKHNFTLAFRVADEKANIVPLLDVEDMIATRKPDWKCVFTYVQTIYARFKNED
ncbi:hypothetical protein RN001_014021 [Aquatica leii]|uniref:Calponin-homology (CH) domain-containing protein n=1 Tax=Aquatica leii TaxID=1421715 RepID=A0AAN7P3M1_9COLE|nr:hypothetical protein RN001_014021 [Aquatica leii]